MSAPDERLCRWITASVYKWITDSIAGSVPIYLEGAERATNTLPAFLEVRYDGPRIESITAENYCAYIEVDILVQFNMGASVGPTVGSKDLYGLDRYLGKAFTALPKSLPVYKYGDGNALLDCMTLEKDHKIHRFGQDREREKITFASVRAWYKLTQ